MHHVNSVKLNKADLFYGLMFLLSFMAFFGEVIFTQVTFCFRDIVRYYHPTHFFATEAVQRGFIPYWNPYVFCGYPFLATVQHALFYPLSLLHYIFPFGFGFKFFFLAHYFAGGIGIYLLLRKIGLSPVSCFVGGVIFAFNGYLLSLTNLLTTLSAVIWMSFCLLLYMEGIKRSWYWAIFIALVLAFQFYSGQPEIMFMSGVLLVLYSLHEWYLNRAGFLKNMAVLILSLSISCLFILPELLLFKEMLSLSVRAKGVIFWQASYWSFHPLELFSTLIQSFSWDFIQTKSWFRQTWLRSFYFGIIPLFFIGLSFANRERRRYVVMFFFLIGMLGLLLSFGKYTPVFAFVYRFFPGFNLIRYPIKYIIFLDISMVVLAAIGFETWVKNQKVILNRYFICFAFLIGGCLFGLIVFKNTFIEWLARNYVLSHSAEAVEALRTYYLPPVLKECGWTILFLLLLAFLWLVRSKLPQKVSLFLLSILLLINVLYVSFADEPLVKSAYYKYRTPVIDFLSQYSGYDKFHFETEYSIKMYLPDLLEDKLPFFGNMNMPFHLFDAGVYDSLDLEKTENVLRILGTQPNYASTPLANMMGLRYIFTERELGGTGLELLGTFKVFRLYENVHSFPRVKIYNRISVNDQLDDLGKVNFLLSKGFNPEMELSLAAKKDVLEEKKINQDTIAGTAALLSYEPNEVSVIVNNENPGWLALFDFYYPGWVATVNGKRSSIYEANYLFRAVQVPAGNSLVKFSYIPVKYYYGLAVFIFVLVLISCGVARKIKMSGGGTS